MTVELIDRVDGATRTTGRSWLTMDHADDYGLTDSWTPAQLAQFRTVARWLVQPGSRGHRLQIVANQDAARAFARAEAVGEIGRRVLDGAVVALRDVSVLSATDD